MKVFFFSKREEVVNAVTHGLGAGLAIAALVILIVWAALYGNAWHVVSFSIFGASLVILYFSSTLYHSFSSARLKFLFRKFDHISIYLLIAGTYTPFCLTVLRGWIGWTMFGVVWACAVIGTIVKIFSVGKKEILSTIMYVLMGWVIILAIKPLYESVSMPVFVWLLLGGLFYTLGTVFFVKDKLPYFHGIWHLFVLAGSVSHFFSVLYLV